MARWTMCLLALLVVGVLAHPEPVAPQEQYPPVPVSQENLEMQKNLLFLYVHPHEPLILPEQQEIANTWDLLKNIDKYNNATAVHVCQILINDEWVLPQGVPFTVLQPDQRWQAIALFNLLYSAKTVDTFYKTAVYLRAHVNEYMFIYVVSVAILHRPDTQGFIVPPLYEIFPSYFNNIAIMTTAQRINTHHQNFIEHYPNTYVRDNAVVIRRNATLWGYDTTKNMLVAYFTHDYSLNNFYNNMHLLYPSWLGGSTVPLVKDRRGEWFLFIHKQILARYYMERLSNGLGEIPVLGTSVVKEGYPCGLQYYSGIPFASRPNYYYLEQPDFVDDITYILEYESRIQEAIDQGYILTPTGQHVDISQPDAIDVIGRIIQSGVDSPNSQYYKDFISIWKTLLGNSEVFSTMTPKGTSLVVPSCLEQHGTNLRDSAFYMIYKRVLKIVESWKEQLPPYTQEELGLPGVVINKVEVDKLVTYFEHTYMNVSNHLYTTVSKRQHLHEDQVVLVEHNRLNHKVFSVRVHVNSDAPKNVVVRLFLAPKYDSLGNEIPLEINSQNFFLFDQFLYTLKQGENVITHSSNENQFATNDQTSFHKMYDKIVNSLSSHDQFLYKIDPIDHFPQRLLLPKGRVGGMPYVVMVHISQYNAPNVVYGTGFNPSLSLGVGSGARRMTSDPLGFPVDRPLRNWQVQKLHNIWFEDVLIHHKHTPEVIVDHLE
ncbi:unnamed protein product [Diatraea saccharalis]|uniref:Uncharacterized protein n=1 Tax=Diatraea saccharalis TaxID=40085 RepID=A0A9N9R3L5_9NEOP|nr:unnamed protein product [Diatraea saccharalis]